MTDSLYRIFEQDLTRIVEQKTLGSGHKLFGSFCIILDQPKNKQEFFCHIQVFATGFGEANASMYIHASLILIVSQLSSPRKKKLALASVSPKLDLPKTHQTFPKNSLSLSLTLSLDIYIYYTYTNNPIAFFQKIRHFQEIFWDFYFLSRYFHIKTPAKAPLSKLGDCEGPFGEVKLELRPSWFKADPLRCPVLRIFTYKMYINDVILCHCISKQT